MLTVFIFGKALKVLPWVELFPEGNKDIANFIELYFWTIKCNKVLSLFDVIVKIIVLKEGYEIFIFSNSLEDSFLIVQMRQAYWSY